MLRLSASGNGETKCIIFVDSLQEARKRLGKYVNVIVGSYPFIKGFGAIVNVHRLDELCSLDFVSAVSAHTNVQTCMNDVRFRLAPSAGGLGFSDFGKNVTVAVIDSGIFPHADFMIPRRRISFFKDFVGQGESAYDDNGHGTAVSGIICGNGLVSNGKYMGIAPKSEIISLKAVSEKGEGGAFAILEAMQWIYANRQKYNIRIVCMSFGAVPLPKNDPLSIGAEVLWKSGITVVASAGNGGPEPQSIRSPGINPSIITVGAVGYSDGRPFIADFSSRGPADGYKKPDIVADGVNIRVCAGAGAYGDMSGTSMSAPIVAGICAAMISKNDKLTPDAIKEILIKNASPIEGDADAVGYGRVEIGFLQEKARSPAAEVVA